MGLIYLTRGGDIGNYILAQSWYLLACFQCSANVPETGGEVIWDFGKDAIEAD